MENKEIRARNLNNNNRLVYFMLFIVVISLPGSVKCDMGETISSMILFFLIALFICAGLGWWSRRQEGSK
jgi:hypothetical protein